MHTASLVGLPVYCIGCFWPCHDYARGTASCPWHDTVFYFIFTIFCYVEDTTKHSLNKRAGGVMYEPPYHRPSFKPALRQVATQGDVLTHRLPLLNSAATQAVCCVGRQWAQVSACAVELIGCLHRNREADVACRVSISPIAAASAQWGNDAEVSLAPPPYPPGPDITSSASFPLHAC